MLADVAGHDAAAAETAEWIQQQLPALASLAPGIAVSHLNAKLVGHLERAALEGPAFATGLWGVIDAGEQTLTLSNFGHPNLLSVDQGSLPLDSGLPIGILDRGISYPQQTFRLRDLGGRVLAYTDGITEQFGADGHMFGPDSLLELFRRSRTEPLAEAVRRMDRELTAYRGEALVKDDQTILGIDLLAQA